MTNKQLKNLKDTLWTTADQLRANSGLKSTEYAEPILGLIFLRFADVKYSKFEPEIKAEFDSIKGTRMERPIHEIAIEKCGFYLPEEARYDWLLNLPESEDLAKKVKEAMEAVEKYTAELEDTLPKDIYYSVNSEDDPLVLAKLLKNFKDIPADVELDIFGEIYEYFLGEFALAEGQGGGEFFTPASVVRYMVEVLAPTEGRILDPACGSGGMFVQTAHYIEKHKAQGKQMNLRAYGVEKTGATVRLAKMNLVLNNVRGTITHANSYYRDPYDSFGNFDYVMANPPFNVDDVELDQVKDQPRFNTYGVPQNKTKSKKKDAKETVPNGNYLWINQFATALNDTGRAALVMANSASDAGNSEKDIRVTSSDAVVLPAINSMTGASGRQRADKRFIQRLKLNLPDLPTQERIADILSTYDDLIESNNRRIELLEQTAQELYKEWFVRFRFPGYENAKFEDGFPKDWTIKRLADYGQVETGKTPSTDVLENYGGEMMFVKTPDMHGNIFIIQTEDKLSERGHNTQPKKLLPVNSIMVSCIGTAGVVSINAEPAHTNQQINSIILNNPNELEWLYHTCKSLKDTIELFGATGATMTNLSKGKFEKLKVVNPREDLILEYHNKVHPLFNEIKSLMYQNQNLAAQRDILLPRLMSGKLEV